MRLYRTPEHACSYLPGRLATTVFVDPFHPMDMRLYGYLVGLGFRRSGNHVYRPACGPCQACIPVRVPVAAFQANRSLRRVARLNQDLQVRRVEAVATDEHFPLYADYLAARHRDGDMYPAKRDSFSAFLDSDWCDTVSYEFRLGERLLAVAVTDRLNDALSAVYTFFDPAASARSLGTYAIAWQIEEARRLRRDWLYLGYWIAECSKMSYKDHFRPQERFQGGRWFLVP
jgi:arginine-tRNA-protein transferase